MTTAENTISVKQAIPLVIECCKADVPVMLWGAPGIGKTELVTQVAATLSLRLHTFVATVKTPVDLSGIPVPNMETMTTVWLRPEDLPSDPCLLFLDDIVVNSPAMQAAMFQLVLERRVGQHKLHPDTRIIAAGNRAVDRAGAQRMPTPLKNRMAHFNLEAEVKGWSAHAAGRIDPYLIAFMNFRALLLHIMPGQTVEDKSGFTLSIDAEANAFPTPRQWFKVNKFIDLPPALRQPLTASLVGEGCAAELEAFMRVFRDGSLPTLEKIVAHPDTAPVPDDKNPATKYAVAAMLCREATRANFDAILTYAARLGREWEMLIAVTAPKHSPDLDKTGGYTTWAVNNQGLTL